MGILFLEDFQKLGQEDYLLELQTCMQERHHQLSIHALCPSILRHFSGEPSEVRRKHRQPFSKALGCEMRNEGSFDAGVNLDVLLVPAG